MRADPYREHRGILAAAEDLLASIRREPRISMQELNGLRNRLATLIRAHRRTEEEQIFGPLFKSGGHERLPGFMADLRKSQQQKSHYSESIRNWTPQAIEADWDGYVRSVAERVGALEDMIRFEEEHIYRPLLGPSLAASPPRAAAGGHR